MAAHAPAPPPAGPTLGQLLGAVVNPPVALSLLVVNKLWDPLADYLGYPCDRQRRIDDHYQAVQRIINECGRLPEALWKVGRSLSIKEKPEEWEIAVELLRQAKLSMVTYQNDDLIDRLTVNYNDLEDNMKDCFLVCSLWSQEENIPLKDLIQWWRGMNLLDELNGHAEGYADVKMLQQLSLLERGENTATSNENSHVRMNPMMHKVVKQILNNRGVTWAPNLSWRPALTENSWLTAQNVWTSGKDVEILRRKKFPGKKLLSNVNVLIARCAIAFEHCQFEGIVFLDMKGVRLETFPSVICMMVKLEYLNLSSTGISSVPLGIGNLSNLKYLCLRNNQKLGPLRKGLIGKLNKLKEFDVFATHCLLNSFLMTELEEADHDYLMLGLTISLKGMFMALSKLPSFLPRVSVLYICLRDLKGCPTISLYMLSDCKKLRELHIVDCSVLRLVAEIHDETQDTHQLLPALQVVAIRDLPNVKEINFQAVGVSITSVSICGCPLVIDLSWIKDLINLEQLIVTRCRMVKKIVSLDVAQQEMVSLPKLKTIHLEHLVELTDISDVTLELESIVHFSVFRCSKLVGLPVGERKPKVILDCDRSFSEKILQDGNESSYIIRVAW